MKKIVQTTFFIALLLISYLKSFSQSYLWAISTGYSSGTKLSSLKRDHSGDIYLAVHKDSMNVVITTTIEKKNDSHNGLWAMNLSGGAVIMDIEFKSNNHPVFTGYYTGSMIIGNDTLTTLSFPSAFIFETDVNGNPLWSVSFNPVGNDFKPVDLFIDKNDNLFLTAEIAGNHGFCSFHKLDATGHSIHDEFNDNFEDRTFSHILTDSLGNIYISGTCGNLATFDTIQITNNFSYQNILIKYDSAFNAQWVISRSYVTFDDNNGLGTDGHFLYWSFNEATQSSDTIRLVKLDHNGQIQLDVQGPLPGAFFPSVSMETDPVGNNLLVSNIYNRLFLFRYDDQFNLIWQDTILANISGTPAQYRIACYDSSFYLGSLFYGDSIYIDSILLWNQNVPDPSDIFITKWGWNIPLSISPINLNSSSIRIYPNPANDHLTIYSSKNKLSSIIITDLTGKIIINKDFKIFGNDVIDVSNIASGIYLLKSEDENSVYINKFVIQR